MEIMENKFKLENEEIDSALSLVITVKMHSALGAVIYSIEMHSALSAVFSIEMHSALIAVFNIEMHSALVAVYNIEIKLCSARLPAFCAYSAVNIATIKNTFLIIGLI